MVELKVHLPSPGMTPSRRRDRYSRDKSLLRKREQSKLEDWANTKCMSFSKNKCKALHVGWNKPRQWPRLGSHSLRCAFGSAGGQKAELKSAAVSQQQWEQPLSWAVSVKARSPHQGMPWLHSATPRTPGSPGSSPTLRHWQTGEGHGGPPSQRAGWKIGGMGTGWRNGVCSAKRNGGLEDLIKLVIFKR